MKTNMFNQQLQEEIRMDVGQLLVYYAEKTVSEVFLNKIKIIYISKNRNINKI